MSSSIYNEDSIPEIIKNIDCIQETQQHSVVIEHNWSIDSILDLINLKKPGEKIESEQFGFEPIPSRNVNNQLPSIENETSEMSKNKQKSNILPAITAAGAIYTELIYDFFLNSSTWRMEINKSHSDLNYISISCSLHNNILSNLLIQEQILFNICQYIEKNESKLNLKLKLKSYLFNDSLNELFKKKTIETMINLKKYFYSLLIFVNKYNSSSNENTNNKMKKNQLVDKFSIDKFCQIKDFLVWLNNFKSNDFCLLNEFSIYSQVLIDDSSVDNPNNSSDSSSSSSSSHQKTSSLLISNYKHGWCIKNWRNFLMPGTASHTFMNDFDISNIFTVTNGGENSTTTTIESNLKFGKFRSKLFNLNTSSSSNLNDKINSINKMDEKIRIDNLLKNVKWKLQLYPNGYSNEFEKNISLFVNFSQLTGELADFSSITNRKQSNSNNNTNSNNKQTSSIEETFYDSNDQTGLILLIKSPSNVNDYLDDSIGRNEKKQQQQPSSKSLNTWDTFVKASFQISILDSDGKKVDKCQSEKQLFELFGSWGYKEWMNINDLIEFKEKYLSNDFNTLNLHCKIILFYTLTVKTFTSDIINTDASILLTNHYQDNILIDIPLAGSNSIATIINNYDLNNNINNNHDTTDYDYVKLKKYHKSYMKKNFMKINSLKECNSLLYDMRRLLTQSNMFDLIIQAPIRLNIDLTMNDNYKQFKVHKLILSTRSEVFEKMFENETSKILNIIDFDAFTIEIFLKYLYTDMVEINLKNFKLNLKSLKELNESYKTINDENTNCNNNDNKLSPTNDNVESDELFDDTEENRQLSKELYTHLFIELFKISDKYCVYRLRQICEMQLIKFISSDNLVELLILAYMHNTIRLKKKCFDYLADNVADIVTQSSWSYLEQNYPILLAEAFKILYFKQN